MASHAFRIVNVFTQGESPLTGNPLCVFENGADFDEATMQALASDRHIRVSGDVVDLGSGTVTLT
jgi:predicted PhzF superfamily epimerase YddE/YHI9